MLSVFLAFSTILGATQVHAWQDIGSYNNEGFAALERALEKHYPVNVEGLQLKDLLVQLDDLTTPQYGPPLVSKLFKTIATAVIDNDCGDYALFTAQSLENKLGQHKQRDLQRVVHLSKTLFKMMADGCAARRFPVARLVLENSSKLVRERVRHLGKHMLAASTNRTTGNHSPSVESAIATEILESSVGRSYVLPVYQAVRARALAERDPDAKYLADVSSLDPETKQQLLDQTYRGEVSRITLLLRNVPPGRDRATALFKEYVFEPCQVYRFDMESILKGSLWEAKHYRISEHFPGNEDFYEALVDYHFCSFAESGLLVDLFVFLANKTIQ